MEENKNSLIIVVIVVAFLAGIGGAYIGGNIVKNNIENKEIDNTKDKDTENKEENKEENQEEEVPKQSNSFYENMLKPYMYTPGDFEIDNISNQFLAQFVLNTYVFDKLNPDDYTNINDDNYDLKATVSKNDVNNLIKTYFNKDNVELENYENTDWYKLEKANDNYIIYTKSTGYDMPDRNIKNVSYNGNEITVIYALYNPYTPNEEIGRTTYKLKYENGNYRVLSKKTIMTNE